MDRTGRLKELQTVLRYLHGRKVNEKAAYDQLKENPRFENWIRFPKVEKIYKQFNNELVKPVKTRSNKPSIEEPSANQIKKKLERIKPSVKKPIVSQIKKPVYSSFKSTLRCDHTIHRCLKNAWEPSSDARFSLYYARLQQNEEYYNFLLHDSFNNKERYVKISKMLDAQLVGFKLLNSEFGLSGEWHNGDFFISSIGLDRTADQMQQIQTIRILGETFVDIICCSSDPTRFVHLSAIQPNVVSVQIYKVERTEIILEESKTMNGWSSFCLNSFFDEKLYGFKYYNERDRLSFPSLYVNSLKPNAQTSLFTLEWPSDNFQIWFLDNDMISCWIRGRFYAVIKFDENANFGIAWISNKNLEWTPLDFRTVKPIISLQFITESSILHVQTADSETKLGRSKMHQIKRTSYRIPLKKPESLAVLSWSALVKSKSKIRGVDPFEESRNYLPFTSELRYPFDD